jgi:DNA polymerase I-like protein with 3'-5' exonuclease and polymerase domains
LRLESLQVGEDGRNRVLLSAYRSITGRNQPSNAKFIFGPATWLRGLIKPPPGSAFVYIDWSSQEIGIGAALSGCEPMMEAYQSGDFYLGFAKQVGLAPAEATKQSHGVLREMVKTVVLGLGYGMGKRTLAARLGRSEADAAELIALYWRAYREFREWLEAAVNHAMLWNSIPTVFGWPMHIEGRYDPLVPGSRPNPRTLRNFPCQGNGAEMLRLAVSLGVESGVKVLAPVHDAIAIETEIGRMQDDIATMREAMAEASRVVLGGFELGTKAETFVYPDRYADPRGAAMWEKVMSLLAAKPG